MAHRRREHDGLPTLQVDFFFPLGSKDTDIKGISVVDVTTGYGGSTMIRWKSSRDQYAVAYILSFMDEVGYVELIFQTDDEPGLHDLAKAVIAKSRRKCQLTVAPTESHQIQGHVERFHQTVKGLARTCLAAVQASYGVEIDKDHLLTSWAIRHAAWVHNR